MASKNQAKSSKSKKISSKPTLVTGAHSLTPIIQGDSGKAEGSASAAPLAMKNFRNHPDMENFYRFIHCNDLRMEAKVILTSILNTRRAQKAPSKKSKQSARKSTRH